METATNWTRFYQTTEATNIQFYLELCKRNPHESNTEISEVTHEVENIIDTIYTAFSIDDLDSGVEFLTVFTPESSFGTSMPTSLESLGYWNDLESLYRKAIQSGENVEDKRITAYFQYHLGSLLLKRGNYSEAELLLFQSLQAEQELKNYVHAATNILELGRIAVRKREFSRAQKYFQGLLDPNVLSDQIIMAALENLGTLSLHKEELPQALKYYQEGLAIAYQIEDVSYCGFLYHQIGSLYIKQNNFTEALNYFEKSLYIKEELLDLPGKAETLHQIGTIYIKKGNYVKARTYIEQSLEIHENLGRKVYIAGALHQLGSICLYEKQMERALEFFLGSLTLKKEVQDYTGIASVLHEIGRLYVETNDYESAEKYLQQSLSIKLQIKHHKSMSSTYHELGRIAVASQNYAKAKSYFEKSIEIDMKYDDVSSAAISKHELGRLLFKTGDFSQGITHVEESLVIHRELRKSLEAGISLLVLGQMYIAFDNQVLKGLLSIYEGYILLNTTDSPAKQKAEALLNRYLKTYATNDLSSNWQKMTAEELKMFLEQII